MYNKFKEALLKATTKEHREEIMELKFGCNVEYCDRKWQELLDHKETYKGKISCIIDKYSQKDFGEYQSKIIIVGDDSVWEIDGKNNIYKGFKDGHLELLEVLGRDITLFDIKQCLMYNNYTDKDFMEIANLWKFPDKASEQDIKTLNIVYEKIKNKKS